MGLFAKGYHHSQLRQFFRAQLAQHADIITGLEASSRHKHRTADFVQGIFDFRDPVSRIDGNQDSTDLRRGKLDNGPFRTVGRPDADPIALLDAQGQQAGRDAVNFRIQFGPRPPDALMPRDKRKFGGPG